VGKNLYDNLALLTAQDQVKFVIADEADYDWAKDIIQQHQLDQQCHVLMSPVADVLSPKTLADWILHDQLPVRFQIQLHKHLWGDTPGT
jgi:7-carboxy-7-deazaguanine synthase